LKIFLLIIHTEWPGHFFFGEFFPLISAEKQHPCSSCNTFFPDGKIN
jgi:hypothetical protein